MGFIYLFRAAWLSSAGIIPGDVAKPSENVLFASSGLVALVMLLDLGRLAAARVAMFNPLIY